MGGISFQKYQKFNIGDIGQDNVATAGTSTSIAFTSNFDDIPVVVACPSTLTTIMIDNKTTAGFDVMVAAVCTVHWVALYQP